MDDATRLARAEEVLGFRFRDRALLLRALTHRSFLNEHPEARAGGHNEVLEFLGDAVLSLVAAEALLVATPDANEGELTVRRAAWVSEAALAAAGERVGVGALLRVGRGEEQTGGALLPSIRADAMEALLGAVHKDAGVEAARAVALRLLGAPPVTVPVAGPNPKTVLQERLQKVFGARPDYAVERKDGPDHAPVYVADVSLRGARIGRGEGTNKRFATEAAAADALRALAALDDAALRERFARATKDA